jgi:hypothetical protein
MPTIAEAVARNVQYQTDNPQPVSQTPTTSGASAAPLVASFPPPTTLPIRGTFPPNLVIGTDFYAGALQFRYNLRSSSGIPPTAVSKTNTPQTLVNKKIVSPVIGGGSPLNRYNSLKVAITPLAVAANTTATQKFTAVGVQASDTLAGWQWTSAQTVGVITLAIRVTGNNQISIDFSNPTAGPLTPTGGVITLVLVR